MSRGIIYVCLSKRKYVDAAISSISSLRNVGYKGPVSIITDQDVREEVDVIGIENISGYNKICRLKPDLLSFSPYDETLYLDCDVKAIKPLGQVWQALDQYHICVTRAPHRSLKETGFTHYSLKELTYTRSVCPDGAFFLNTGVIMWKKGDKSNALFDDWAGEIEKFNWLDELAFTRAIYKIEHNILPRHFNDYKIKDKTVLHHDIGSIC